MEETESPEPCRTHSSHLSEMGPQTAGAVGVTPKRVNRVPYPVISNHKSFQWGLRSVIRFILFFRR